MGIYRQRGGKCKGGKPVPLFGGDQAILVRGERDGFSLVIDEETIGEVAEFVVALVVPMERFKSDGHEDGLHFSSHIEEAEHTLVAVFGDSDKGKHAVPDIENFLRGVWMKGWMIGSAAKERAERFEDLGSVAVFLGDKILQLLFLRSTFTAW